MPVCKTRFEKVARIFSRQHKKPTFSDAGFLGILRVKLNAGFLGILRVKLLLTRQSLYTGRSHKVLSVLWLASVTEAPLPWKLTFFVGMGAGYVSFVALCARKPPSLKKDRRVIK